MQSGIQNSRHKKFFEFLISVGILLLSTLVSVALEYLGVKELNIILIYLIGILLITIETSGYFWGSVSCILSILLFNFFFTQPRYTLQVNDPNYFICFFLFLIVAFIASTLVSRLQKHAAISRYNEKQTNLLYEISVGYLNISGLSNILNYGLASLNKLQLFPAIVYPAASPTTLLPPYYPENMDFYSDLPENDTIALWCLTNMIPCGCGTAYFNRSGWKFIPMKRENKMFGVVAFFCNGKDMSSNDMLFIDTIMSQMALALQREDFASVQETLRMDMEKEQLQDNILLSLSYDLRAPLTRIVESSDLMLQSYDKLDKKRMISLLGSIATDANQLIRLTENLLSITRIQAGHLDLNKQAVAVNDIVYEAIHHMETLMLDHPLAVHVPEQVITISVDNLLIVQVLVNLLDNAVKHTTPEATIEISAYHENNYLVFEVADDGGGIDSSLLDVVFHGFVVGGTKNPDAPNGLGLGLSICKSIVDAHDGKILAINNNNGGATFRVLLPLNHDN